MKFSNFASSIRIIALFFPLVGCEDIGLPNYFGHDDVPDAIKQKPLAVERAGEVNGDTVWPRLGDVPAKPKDFSPKAVNDHYMNEMVLHREEAAAVRKEAEINDPTPQIAAPQKMELQAPQFKPVRGD